jgi:dolichyl-phosphate beta-glucosyltransferase
LRKRQGGPEISVVVPAYNEAVRLQATLPRLWGALNRRFAGFEVIVVDDGSSDGTARVVTRFSATHPNVRLVSYPQNRGKGFAVKTGMLTAIGEYVLFSDADLSTPVREVRKLLAALRDGYDVAIGSRASRASKILKCQPLYRICLGKIFNRLVQILTVAGISDTQCGFKCFRRPAVREIFENCRVDGFSFDVEALFLARRKGLRIKEIGVLWRNSSLSTVHPVRHSLQMLRDLFVIRFYSFTGCYGPSGYAAEFQLAGPDKPRSTARRP